MAEARRRWSWRNWLPDVGAAFSRFPLAVLLAAFLTLFKLWADNRSEAEFKILGMLAASFLWVVAVDLFVESQGRSRRTRVMAWVAGIAGVEGRSELRFNLMDAARALANPLSKEQHPLRLKASSNDLKGVLLIDNLNGSYKEPNFNFSLIRFWLVLKQTE